MADDSPESSQEPQNVTGHAARLDYAGVDTKPGLVTIARFHDSIEAHMAASRLEADEIEVVVTDHRSGTGLGRWPGSLAVAAEDAFRAIAILMTTPAKKCIIAPFQQEK